jgi:lipoate-protein ligase A
MAWVNYMNAGRCGFAMPLFKVIDLFVDKTGRGGPEQMALDEALFECAERPLMRLYRWSGQAVTFGYSQPLEAVRERFRSIPCVRRWTGGGIVEHGCDWTFSLIVPFGEPLAKARPKESYRLIHACVAAALNQCGYSAHLADSGQGAPAIACFSSPVLYDVIGLDYRKLCGGAQRRTLKGLLHQGSLQTVRLLEGFAFRLLSLMAERTVRFLPGRAALDRAHELLVQKYGTSAWLGKVSREPQECRENGRNLPLTLRGGDGRCGNGI